MYEHEEVEEKEAQQLANELGAIFKKHLLKKQQELKIFSLKLETNL